MPSDIIDPTTFAKGEVRLHIVPEVPNLISCRTIGESTNPAKRPSKMLGTRNISDWKPKTLFEPNAFMYDWATIVGSLLMRKDIHYGIAGMYIEFENVASPGDPVSIPSFTRDEGVSYYNDLATSSDRDYLRVALTASSMDSTDLTKFPKGNRPTFFAQTSGVVGVHGKPFSDANNSVVFGGALVSFLDPNDFTQDLVLSRFYTTVGSQQSKLATSQIGFEWRVTLN